MLYFYKLLAHWNSILKSSQGLSFIQDSSSAHPRRVGGNPHQHLLVLEVQDQTKERKKKERKKEENVIFPVFWWQTFIGQPLKESKVNWSRDFSRKRMKARLTFLQHLKNIKRCSCLLFMSLFRLQYMLISRPGANP